jgi:hypothetical protein
LAATTTTTMVRLEDEASADGETTTAISSGDGEKAVATIGVAEAADADAAASSSALEGSEIMPSSSDIVIPTSAKEEETIGADTPPTTTTTIDDEPAGFASGPNIPTGTVMEEIGAQAKEAVIMDQVTTDLSETISSSSLPDIPTTDGGTTLEDNIGGGGASTPVATNVIDGATHVGEEEEARSSLADIP